MNRSLIRYVALLACLLWLTGTKTSASGQSGAGPTDVGFMAGDARISARFFPAVGPGSTTVLLLTDLPDADVGGTAAINLGYLLSRHGLNVLTFNYRGTHRSEGAFTISGADQDIDAARRWLSSEEASRFDIDPDDLVIGGYGFGGGMALAYSASDLAITRVFSISGLDLSRAMARYASDPVYAEALRAALNPNGADAPAVRWERDDFFAFVKEALQSPGRWDLHAAAPQLARKRILLMGGLDDTSVPVEDYVLPLYRSLRGLGTQDLDIALYQSSHSFAGVEEEIARVLADWAVQ